MSDYDVRAVRERYPALSDGWAYLDGAAGTQVPEVVIAAESAAYRGGLGNHGGYFAASLRSDELTRGAREAVADLVNAPSPDCVAFGPSTTAMIFRAADALSRQWKAGDEIILTRLDHDANVRPWVLAAEAASVTVRWADPEPSSLELPPETLTALIGDRTRLVAVTAASNVIGTRPDLPSIAAAAHAAGALVMVDGVHATPHTVVDVQAWGADLYATSAYKWSGPHLAALIGTPSALESMWPAKLASSTDEIPDRFEYGTNPFAQHAGITAAVEHLASLAWAGAPEGSEGGLSRRDRLVKSLTAVERHEEDLLGHLLAGLAELGHVHRLGHPRRLAPTLWFRVDGFHPDEVAESAARARINLWSGHNYAWELAGFLGVRDSGSAVRASLACYSTAEEVDRLLEFLAGLRS